MAATPATAKTKYSGSTVLTFDKKLAPIVSGIVRIKPAKGRDARISFPVTGVADGGAIIHKGGIGVGAVEVSDPVIVINGPNNSARILVTLAFGPLELFTVRNLKSMVTTKKEILQGALRLTTNEVVVQALNDAVGTPAFRPGMAMGKIKTTIKIKKWRQPASRHTDGVRAYSRTQSTSEESVAPSKAVPGIRRARQIGRFVYIGRCLL